MEKINNKEKKKILNLKNLISSLIILLSLMAYITFSAFIGGNLEVKNINVTSNMLQTRIVQSKLSELVAIEFGYHQE